MPVCGSKPSISRPRSFLPLAIGKSQWCRRCGLRARKPCSRTPCLGSPSHLLTPPASACAPSCGNHGAPVYRVPLPGPLSSCPFYFMLSETSSPVDFILKCFPGICLSPRTFLYSGLLDNWNSLCCVPTSRLGSCHCMCPSVQDLSTWCIWQCPPCSFSSAKRPDSLAWHPGFYRFVSMHSLVFISCHFSKLNSTFQPYWTICDFLKVFYTLASGHEHVMFPLSWKGFSSVCPHCPSDTNSFKMHLLSIYCMPSTVLRCSFLQEIKLPSKNGLDALLQCLI